VAHGLAAAHAQGIVHRDVKPPNVLLGKDGSIKVADFGIADLVARTREEQDTVFGTPGYLAPEVLLGAAYGPPADLYALGVLLYECLVGAPPFGGTKPDDVVHATLFGVLRAPHERVPGVLGIPPRLESLVLQLLHRDPRARPAEARAVAAELDRMAADLGVVWDVEQAGAPAMSATPAEASRAFHAARPAQWLATVRLRPTRSGVRG
jgi:serine/threonine-protein kinase